MQLHCVGAQNLGLREFDTGMANGIHACFEIGYVLLEAHSFWSGGEAPVVNTSRDVIEAGANIDGKTMKRRLKLLRETIFMAVL